MVELHELTSDICITVKIVRYQLQQEKARLHKIDALTLDSGYESSGHMSSETSCLCGGMALFRVRGDSIVGAR